jgi:hypothetical protein
MSEIKYTGTQPEVVDGVIVDQEITLVEQASSPSTPPSGYTSIFAKTDGKVYQKTDAGAETDLTQGSTGGSGSGTFKNLLQGAIPVATANSVSFSKYNIADSVNSVFMKSTDTTAEVNYYSWDFNEGTGTTISANKGSTTTQLTTAGSPTWGSGYLACGANTSDNFIGATGAFSQLNNFSIALWIEFTSLSNGVGIFNLSNGTSGTATNYSFNFYPDTTGFNINLSNGSTVNNISAGTTLSTNTKYFAVISYERIGGTANNIIKIRYTSNGTTWVEGSSSACGLMLQNSGFSFRRTYTGGGTPSATNYHRIIVYPDRILTTDEMQSIYSTGSEGSLSNVIIDTKKTTDVLFADPVPSQWDFNEGIGTTVVDSKGVSNLTTAGSVTWGSGYLQVPASSGAGWAATTGFAANSNCFSIATWVEFVAVGNKGIISIGNGTTANSSNNAVTVYLDTSNRFTVNTYPTGTLTTSLVATTGVKYLVIYTYQRNGGSANNAARVRVTSNGIDWYEASSTTAGLMVQSSTYTLRSQWGSGFEANARYHRVLFYPERTLTNSEMQSIYDTGSEGTLATPTPHTYTFNEGAGTSAADSKGYANLTTSNSWGSGYYATTTADSSAFSSAAGAYSQMSNFSIATWIEFNSLANAGWLAIGQGVSASSTYNQLALRVDSTNKIGAVIYSGDAQPTSGVTANQVISTGVKYLVVFTYTRTGGANNNLATIRITSDGVNWIENSITNSVLMARNSAFSLRSLWGSSFQLSAKYYRVEVYKDKVLSNSEMQTIWNNGSEGSLVSPSYGQINGFATSSSLNGLISSSGTTITGSGTSFSTDFVVGDVITAKGESRKITAIASNTSMTVSSAFSANLSSTIYIRGGKAASTWYYAYCVSNSDNTSNGFIVSTRNISNGDSLVDLPSGYTNYRQLPIALRCDANSMLIPFRIDSGWPYRPVVTYDRIWSRLSSIVSGSSASEKESVNVVLPASTASTYTTVDASSFVPPISTEALVHGYATAQNGDYFTSDSTNLYDEQILINWANAYNEKIENVETNSSQTFYTKRASASGAKTVSIFGYVVTNFNG